MAEEERRPVVEILDGSGVVLDAVTTDDIADLELVDALARLQLAACRLGLAVRVRDAGPELSELLELTGVAGVVGCRPERPRRVSVPRLPRPWR